MILKPVHRPFIVKRKKKAEIVARKLRPDDTFNSKVTQSHKGIAILKGNYPGEGC